LHVQNSQFQIRQSEQSECAIRYLKVLPLNRDTTRLLLHAIGRVLLIQRMLFDAGYQKMLGASSLDSATENTINKQRKRNENENEIKIVSLVYRIERYREKIKKSKLKNIKYTNCNY